MDDPGSREDAFCCSVADFCRSSAVFRARVAESVRLMTQVAESKQSLDDLEDARMLFRRPNWHGSARDRVFKGLTLQISQIEAVHHFLTSQRRSWTHKQCWGLL